jgi:RNA polymerase sigma-70 factor (ECF subfamily)
MDAHARQVALDKARHGDVQALGDLLESFRPYARVIVQALHDNRLQAHLDDSDLIQDALLEAHRGFPQFRGTVVAELVVWLRQIIIRSAGRTLRGFADTAKRDLNREQGVADLGALPASNGMSPSALAIRHEQAARMAEALTQLPDDMQQVLFGRHLDDLSHAAIAQRLGRTEHACRMLYLRALRRLRELYQE